MAFDIVLLAAVASGSTAGWLIGVEWWEGADDWLRLRASDLSELSELVDERGCERLL